MSKVKSLHHIVFATKNRLRVLNAEHRQELFSYIAGIMRNKNSFPLIVNGVEDHVHILVDVHPSVSISELVKEVKRCSSAWITASRKFPYFMGWAKEYAAFSSSDTHREAIVRYIRNQEEHHRNCDYFEEYAKLCSRNGVDTAG